MSRTPRSYLAVIAGRLVIIAFILVAWQMLSGVIADELLISTPLAIFERFGELLLDGEIIEAAAATVYVVVLGVLYGTLAGIAAGMFVALNRTARAVFEPIVDVLFAIPKIGLVPLFILWLGVSYSQRIVFTATVVFFFMFYAALHGVQRTPAAMDRMMRLLGSSPWQRLRLLYAPASLGWLIGGLRITMPYAFIAAISAEVVSSREGLGAMVKDSAAVLDTPGMFAGIIVATILATSAGALADLLSRLWRDYQ